MDDDYVKCPECGAEVPEEDVCQIHGVCGWCDEDCKFEDVERNRLDW